MKQQFFKEIVELLKKDTLSKEKLSKIKVKLCKKYGLKKIPTDIEILLNAEDKDLPKLKQLQTKPTRSLSGVAVVAIMTKPFKCPHGKCTICPGGPSSYFGDIPQSYTGKEPATMRGLRNKFDPYLQVFNRLEQYIVTGHTPDKVELIIMGGTFPSFPKKYQEDFVKYSFKAMNDFSKLFFRNGKFDFIKFKKFFELPGKVGSEKRTKSIQKRLLKLKGRCSLEQEQKKNEKSKIRCVGLTAETRPDYGKLKEGIEMLRLGCTRVEIGVQSVYDKVLKKIERGHSVQDIIESTQTLKDLGFKINYHYMLGLPGSNKKIDLEGFKKLFSADEFKPDMLKLYPCMVVRGTKLYRLWKQGKFKALTTSIAAKLISECKKHVPEYCRIMRVQRDIPTYQTEAGVDRTNLRQYVQEIMKKQGIKCRCIRCREIGRTKSKGKTKIKITKYGASKGKEFFIAAESGNALLGFCRLRFPSESLRKEITKSSALIRELHVYGTAAGIGQEGDVQHKGIGKNLLKKAEQIAKSKGKNKIVVISGVGVRRYYRKLGYKKQGPYMVKNIGKIYK